MTNSDDGSIVNGAVIFISKYPSASLRLLSVADQPMIVIQRKCRMERVSS